MVGGAAVLVVTTAIAQLLPHALGVVVAEDAWTWALTNEPHSQMPLGVLGGTGFAVAVLGACLWLADALPRVSRPVADLGRLALSVYVAHLLLFHLTDDLLVARTVGEGARKVLTFAATSALFSFVWLRLFARGPLESVVRGVWSRLAPRPEVSASDD